MSASGFPGPAARSSPGRLELVHVDSGAVLASRVRLDRLATPQHLAWLRGNSAPGDEAALVTVPARWAQTFFASAPTDVVFVDGGGRIVKLRRSMRPWRVALALGANGAIQAMPGFITRNRTRVGDRLALREEQAAQPVPDAASWHAGFDEGSDSARAQFHESVTAGLEDQDSGTDPWGVEPGDVQDHRPAAISPPAPSSEAPPSPRVAESAPPRAEQGTRAAARPSPSRAFLKGVDLETLTARGTPLAWFEAVAVVQELCAVLAGTRKSAPPEEFEPADVAITAEGSVEVSGGASHGLPAVPQVGHVLLTLLGEAQTLPVQLRLLALQEVSPTPRCSTLIEFSTQLAVFERPNRQATIREVYQRFLAMPARPADAPAAPAAKPARAARKRSVRAPLWRQRTVRAAAVVTVVLVLTGVAASVVWQGGVPLFWGNSSAGGSGAAAGDGTSLPDEAAARIREAAMRIWGAGARVTAPVPAKVPAGQPATLELPAAVPAGSLTTPAVPGDPVPAGGGEPRSPVTGSAVFSSVDTDVVPAVLMRPHLPATPRPGVRVEDLPQVELVVSPAGDVESVKLLTTSAGVHSAMMLSAIKTWHFQPASRDGHPVRYRLVLRLTNQ